MFANLYIFVCGACGDSFPLFFWRGVSVCVWDHSLRFSQGVDDAILPVSQRAQIFICT